VRCAARRLLTLEADRGKARAREARADLLAFEAQAAALQRAAESTREEAEVALEETSRELNRRLLQSTSAPPPLLPLAPLFLPRPGSPRAPGRFHPRRAALRFWFESEEQEESRSP
jgi:hypothetical protein